MNTPIQYTSPFLRLTESQKRELDALPPSRELMIAKAKEIALCLDYTISIESILIGTHPEYRP